MATTHFTNATLKTLSAGEWTDERYPNLRFRVGAKTRTWLFRLPKRADGSKPGHKLGRFPDLPLEAAVKKYTLERARIAQGEPHPDVHQRIKELEAELRALKRAAGDLITFGQLVDRFFAEYEPRTSRRTRALAPGVIYQYTRMLKHRALPLWRDTDVGTIQEHDIEKLVLSIKGENKPVAARSLLVLLKTIFGWGVKKRIISQDPTAFIDRPPKPDPRTRVLSPDEIRAAWHAFSEIPSRHGAALQLLMMTGQRRAEVAECPWSEIQGDWWCLQGERTKSGKPNLIFVTSLARRILEQARQSKSRYVFRGYVTADKPIAPNYLSGVCRGVSDALLKDGKIASRFTTHDLRRTVATTARSAGVDRRVVKRILNHSSNEVTDVYDLYGMRPEIQAAMTTWDAYLTDLLGL